MRLDNIQEPETLWYEDAKGNVLIKSDPMEFPKGWKYQHCKSAVVVESVCKTARDPKWPVRMLKWIIRHLPYSWQGNACQVFRGEATMNCVYPIISYLVEKKKWRFPDACIAATELCERCMNVCLWELNGEDLRSHKHYMDTVGTTCHYCEQVDPGHIEQRKVKACYKALKHNKNIKEAWEQGYCSGDAKEQHRPENIWTKIKDWYYR